MMKYKLFLKGGGRPKMWHLGENALTSAIVEAQRLAAKFEQPVAIVEYPPVPVVWDCSVFPPTYTLNGPSIFKIVNADGTFADP